MDSHGRCRWSTSAGEPLIFVKYAKNRLNILDVEKKTLILTAPVALLEEPQSNFCCITHRIFLIFAIYVWSVSANRKDWNQYLFSIEIYLLFSDSSI